MMTITDGGGQGPKYEIDYSTISLQHRNAQVCNFEVPVDKAYPIHFRVTHNRKVESLNVE